jgi:hypothetical protein
MRLGVPRSRPTTSHKISTAGNQTQTSGSVATNYDHQTAECLMLYKYTYYTHKQDPMNSLGCSYVTSVNHGHLQ